jgi:hypothetical protein
MGHSLAMEVLAVAYGLVVATYMGGVCVVGLKMRKKAGVRFFGFLPSYVGWRAAFRLGVLVMVWPFSRRERQGWLSEFATPLADR